MAARFLSLVMALGFIRGIFIAGRAASGPACSSVRRASDYGWIGRGSGRYCTGDAPRAVRNTPSAALMTARQFERAGIRRRHLDTCRPGLAFAAGATRKRSSAAFEPAITQPPPFSFAPPPSFLPPTSFAPPSCFFSPILPPALFFAYMPRYDLPFQVDVGWEVGGFFCDVFWNVSGLFLM